MTYYKATNSAGRDFYTGRVDYAGALATGVVLKHPVKVDGRSNSSYAGDYFSVATVPTDCTGMSWPCRLFEVEPAGRVWTPDVEGLPNKRACRSLRVVRELDAIEALGPQGAQLRDLIGTAARLTEPQLNALVAAWDAAWVATRDAAWDATWVAGRDAAWVAGRAATRALTVRDLIGDEFTQAHYDLLTDPWATTIGRVHPDDPDRMGGAE